MRALLLVALMFTFGCDAIERHDQAIYLRNYNSIVDDIIEYDKINSSYITLGSLYGGLLDGAVSDVAIPDGWVPVGGRTCDGGGVNYYHQSLSKINKDLYLLRVGDKFKIRKHSEKYK